jgi:hypothetical protein
VCGQHDHCKVPPCPLSAGPDILAVLETGFGTLLTNSLMEPLVRRWTNSRPMGDNSGERVRGLNCDGCSPHRRPKHGGKDRRNTPKNTMGSFSFPLFAKGLRSLHSGITLRGAKV